ncbi:hypothetical protein ES705_43303 [subsurface metagenome]
MILKTTERFSSLSHLTGAAAAMLGTLALIIKTRHRGDLLGISLVYGFSVVFLFSASTIYHARKRSEDENSLWRKFDHLAIFFMIAGTYTPLYTMIPQSEKPNIEWTKDRSKDVELALWYHRFNGDCVNDHHLPMEEKRVACEAKAKETK